MGWIALRLLRLAVVRVSHFVTHQRDYEAKNYPVRAVDFLISRRLPGPIYNDYGWGGYLIRRLYFEYRIYIDGRADVYGDQFMDETFAAYDGLKSWRQPLDRFGVKTVLIGPNTPLASLLRNDVNWIKIYEDDQSVIFTKSDKTESTLGSDKKVELLKGCGQCAVASIDTFGHL